MGYCNLTSLLTQKASAFQVVSVSGAVSFFSISASSLIQSRVKSQVSGKNERSDTFGAAKEFLTDAISIGDVALCGDLSENSGSKASPSEAPNTNGSKS